MEKFGMADGDERNYGIIFKEVARGQEVVATTDALAIFEKSAMDVEVGRTI